MAMFSTAGADEPGSAVSTPVAKAHVPPFDEMLHQYLLNQANRHFDARRKAIAAIKTPDDIARQTTRTPRLFSSLAGRPTGTYTA